VSHQHYDADLDRRWPCAVPRCLLHDVSPRPLVPMAPPPCLHRLVALQGLRVVCQDCGERWWPKWPRLGRR
jgi:hypothetical protein